MLSINYYPADADEYATMMQQPENQPDPRIDRIVHNYVKGLLTQSELLEALTLFPLGE